MKKKTKVKAVYVSDLHLGSKASKCRQFLDFLNKYDFEELYLLGDIIDGYALANKFYWEPVYTEVLSKIAKLTKTKKVVYVIGNHDSFIKNLPTKIIPDIEFVRSYKVSRKNREILLIHGDQLEQFLQVRGWLYRLGSWCYNKLLFLNRLTGFNFAGRIKKLVKASVSYIGNFEESAALHAENKGCNMVICGHIHKPHSSTPLKNNLLYLNCGDWTENCSAVIETESGHFEFYSCSGGF
jgi:UDP-2,3-diacylglucosamine pyrophosphatase LpxH